jgi:hypothetical protein
MMFDDLKTTREQLITQVRAVCKALKYIRSVTALDTLPHYPDGSENPKYTEWCRQMGIAGRARVDVEMAGEYIRDELSYESRDKKGVEWEPFDDDLESETIEHARLHDDLKTVQQNLIGEIKAVCKALKYIREAQSSDIRSRDGFSSRNTRYIKWFEHMTIASDAQVEIETAGKCIRAEVSDEQFQKCIEWNQLEKELERKRKQYTRKRHPSQSAIGVRKESTGRPS